MWVYEKFLKGKQKVTETSGEKYWGKGDQE